MDRSTSSNASSHRLEITTREHGEADLELPYLRKIHRLVAITVLSLGPPKGKKLTPLTCEE